MGRRRFTTAVGVLSMTFAAACGGEPPAEETMPEEGIAPPAPAETPADTPAAPTDTADTTGAAGAQTGQLPEGVTPEMVAAGQQIFTGEGLCSTCHGPDATGTPLAPNLTDDTWLNVSGRNYDEIVALIKAGVPQPVEAPAPMLPRGGSSITDEQVDEVAAYVVSLGQR